MGALGQRRVALSMCEGGRSRSLSCARGKEGKGISGGAVRLIDCLRGAAYITLLGLSEGALWVWDDAVSLLAELCSDLVARQIPLEDSDSADDSILFHLQSVCEMDEVNCVTCSRDLSRVRAVKHLTPSALS